MKTFKQFLKESKQINEAFSDEEIMKWLEKYDRRFNKNTYTIKNGIVDVKGNVKLNDRKLKEIPFQFGKVDGDFDCSFNNLTSLKNTPKEVKWEFNCGYNNLTSLEGAPEKVGLSFYCYNNKLTSLKGCPKKVDGDFNCEVNNLTSLVGSPKEVDGVFYCSLNKLTSLEGAPKEVAGDFECKYNRVKFTEDDVRKICNVKGKIIV